MRLESERSKQAGAVDAGTSGGGDVREVMRQGLYLRGLMW